MRRYLYITVFSAGMTTLALELTASRLLGSVFGTSNLVWASIIGLILIYLAVGYSLGAWLADRYPYYKTMFSILAWGAFSAGLVPLLSRPVLRLAAEAFDQLQVGILFGSFSAVLVLFCIPVILLGTISPFAIRLAMTDTSEAGRVSGRIYAVSSAFAAKYASIVIINGLDGSELLPILTTIQNVYTDPQVPNIVEPKLYEIGPVNENSPVLWTTNFSLTCFCVVGEIERSKVPCFISVVDSGGLGILNAYAGDKVSPDKVVKTLEAQKVAEKVKHRKLISPGLLPSFRAEIEDSSPWKQVMIGPENASGIPGFLKANWKV